MDELEALRLEIHALRNVIQRGFHHRDVVEAAHQVRAGAHVRQQREPANRGRAGGGQFPVRTDGACRMTGAGTQARSRFFDNMAKIAIGAKLARRRVVWTITAHRHFDTSTELVLTAGRRTIRVAVPICHTGPCLADVELQSVALAPTQKGLFA